MKFRSTLIMLVILLAVGSYVYFYEMKGSEQRESEKETSEKLLAMNKDSVSAMVLTHSGISLKKEEGKWTVVAPVRAGVEESAITGILNSVESAKRERAFAEQPANLPTYGLGPSAPAIILTSPGKQDTIYTGDKNLTGSSIFARLNSDTTVYLTSSGLLTNAQKSLFEVRDKTILTFEVSAATSMKLKLPQATYEVRKEDGKWKLQFPIQALADESKVNQLLNRVRNGRVKRFIEEEPADIKQYGLDKPLYEMEVRYGSDNAIKTLRIGKADKDAFHAQDSSRPPVFAIDSSLVRDLNVKLLDLRERRLADFQSWEADEVTIEYSGRKISCMKDTAGTWYLAPPDSGKAKSWKVSELTGAAGSLRAEKFVEASMNAKTGGLDQPRAKIIVKRKGSEVANILLGNEERDLVFAKSSFQPGMVMVKKADADKFFVTRSDLAEELKP